MPDPTLIALTRAEAAFLQTSFAGSAGHDARIALRCDPSPELSRHLGRACLVLSSVEKVGAFPGAYDLRRPELSEDMVQTILRYFDAGQKDGSLLIESTPRGLWFACPHEIRLFIGLARLPGEGQQPVGQSTESAALAGVEP